MDGMPDIVFPFLFMRSIGANTPMRTFPNFFRRPRPTLSPYNLVTWACAEHLLAIEEHCLRVRVRCLLHQTRQVGSGLRKERKSKNKWARKHQSEPRPRPRPRPRAPGEVHFGRTRKLCKRQQLSVQHQYLPAAMTKV